MDFYILNRLMIDEAGQATEPETISPISRVHEKGQIVLVGDHMQLRPHVTNRTASHAGLDTSLETSDASVWGVRALPRIARQILEDVVGIIPTFVLSADCLDTYRINKKRNPKWQCVM